MKSLPEKPNCEHRNTALGAVQARLPIVVAKYNLGVRAASRRGSFGRGALSQNCQHIVIDQALGRAPPQVHAAAGDRARAHKKHVRSHCLNLILHRLLSTLTDSQHSNHGSDANDDAEHGERRAQLVAGQGAHRNSKDSS